MSCQVLVAEDIATCRIALRSPSNRRMTCSGADTSPSLTKYCLLPQSSSLHATRDHQQPTMQGTSKSQITTPMFVRLRRVELHQLRQRTEFNIRIEHKSSMRATRPHHHANHTPISTPLRHQTHDNREKSHVNAPSCIRRGLLLGKPSTWSERKRILRLPLHLSAIPPSYNNHSTALALSFFILPPSSSPHV